MEGLHFFQLFNQYTRHALFTLWFTICSHVLYRQFRNIDDDGSKSLDYAEFKKGLQDFGLTFADDVSLYCRLNVFYMYIGDNVTTFLLPISKRTTPPSVCLKDMY